MIGHRLLIRGSVTIGKLQVSQFPILLPLDVAREIKHGTRSFLFGAALSL